ncbi:major facilitator superfamily domain-containing protein [Aspergillus californicus]
MFSSSPQPEKPPGYAWRSSRLFIVIVLSIAMFTDYFLFSFIIPIMPDILQGRLRVSQSHTQLFTSIILSMNAIVSIAIAPLIGYLADRVKWKNNLMITSYLMNMVGTAVTAWSTTLAGLIIGRLIQTIAGSLLWIAGMAILGASIPQNQLARSMSICMLFISAGLLSAPVISAALFNSVSYSLTWLAALLVLLIGTGMQCLMLEPYNFPTETKDYSSPARDHEHDHDHENQHETDPLLAHQHQSHAQQDPHAPATSRHIYSLMLRKRRVTTSLIAETLFATLISSFEATIPLHIKAVFHWQSLQAGFLFLLLQAPTLLLVFPAGWLKDSFGMRLPVTAGFLLLAPSLWLLGVPGNGHFAWADGGVGRGVYVGTLVSIGVCRTLVLGIGGVEVLRGANELATEYPGIFGSRTGHSRAFVLSNITWKLGMFVGPLASGFLTESIGYYLMNVILAILCLAMGITVFLALRTN